MNSGRQVMSLITSMRSLIAGVSQCDFCPQTRCPVTCHTAKALE